jgi:hypothetical protein
MLKVYRKPGEGYANRYMGILLIVLPDLSGAPIAYYAEPTEGFVHSIRLSNVCIKYVE